MSVSEREITEINNTAERIKNEYCPNVLELISIAKLETLDLDSQEAAWYYVSYIKKDVNLTFSLLKRWFPFFSDELTNKIANDPYNVVDYIRELNKEAGLTEQTTDAFVTFIYIMYKDLMNELAKR